MVVSTSIAAIILVRAERGATASASGSFSATDYDVLSDPRAIKQETTLHETDLPDATDSSSSVPTPKYETLIAEETEEDKTEEIDPGQDDVKEEEPEEQDTPSGQAEPVRTGRVIFVGDSRTIDMFADSNDPIEGAMHDDISVYARHGNGYGFLENVVNQTSLTANDTLVTWMGANDDGNSSNYCALYNRLLSQGVGLIVCTVGPTSDGNLQWWDQPYYTNDKMVHFNAGLTSWANANGVKIIDLYSYIQNNILIDPADGIHYMPRPDPSLWAFILANI